MLGMTATTNLVIMRDIDGELIERSGVYYAEQAYHVKSDVGGVSLQYVRTEDQEEPRTEFVEGAEIVGVYDEMVEQEAKLPGQFDGE